MTRDPESGFTLIEMLVALVLFALIGVAGFGVLDTVLRARDRTEGRLEQLAALDRTMILVGRDLAQIDGGDLVLEQGQLLFRRGDPGGAIGLGYGLGAAGFMRRARLPRAAGAVEQTLLPGAETAQWRLWHPATGWVMAWPVEDGPDALPRAAELTLRLGGRDGVPATEARRLVDLPQPPAT